MGSLRLALVWLLLGGAPWAWAGPVSVFQASLGEARAPLVALGGAPAAGAGASLWTAPAGGGGAGSASLFVGRQGGLFAPVPQRRSAVALPGTGSQVARLRQLIARAEAGRHGYDAVQHGAAVRPGRPPTEMTLGEIHAWIEATPGQPHAIGRYQFIPATLKRVSAVVGAGPDAVFAPELQDRLADVLLAEAGLGAFGRGEIGRHAFMHNLAKIWAGLPTSTGLSYYHGHAGNRATMTWAAFDAEMGRIFPG